MKNKAIFIVFILVQLISCAKKNNEAQKLPSSNNQIPILNPTDWQEFVLGEDERKLLKIRKLEASKFFLEDQKKKYLQTALVNVPVDPKYNVSLFKIAGIDIYKDTI